MQIQMQDELHLDKFSLQSRFQGFKLHRTSCKRTVEHCFNYFADMERNKLATFNSGYLQHNCKHFRMQIQMQIGLFLGWITV